MNGVQTVLNDVENIFYTKKIKPQPQKFYKDILSNQANKSGCQINKR